MTPNNHLSDEEFVRRVGMLYEQVMSFRKDEDYVVNQPQMDRLIKLAEFFYDVSVVLNGDIEPIVLEPKAQRGDVIAHFLVFDLNGEDVVRRFCDVVQWCSAVGVDSTNHGVCISCTIPNVFVHK